MSGKVAKKEHAQIVEVLKSIEALPPGLYGMEIHEEIGRNGEVEYDVTIHERSLEDLKKLQKYDRVDEKPFEAVAALSELTERAYELSCGPRSATRCPNGSRARCAYGIRCARSAGCSPIATRSSPAFPRPPRWRAHGDSPRKPDNAGRRAEKLGSSAISASLDLYRGLRDAACEAAFFQIYGNMMSLQMADQRAAIRSKTRFDPRALPAVRQVLDDLDRGGLPEAVVRSGLLVTKAGGGEAAPRADRKRARAARAVRRARGTDRGRPAARAARRTIVVELEPAQAKRTLPRLVATQSDRRKLNRLFDALAEDDPHLNDKQRGLVAELQKLVRGATGGEIGQGAAEQVPLDRGSAARPEGCGASGVESAHGRVPHREGCDGRSARARAPAVGRADAALDRQLPDRRAALRAGTGR